MRGKNPTVFDVVLDAQHGVGDKHRFEIGIEGVFVERRTMILERSRLVGPQVATLQIVQAE
jgi:hypothetical protein